MLKFVQAAEVAKIEGLIFTPKDQPLDGQTLAKLTELVVNRFIGQVDWDGIVTMYLGGLADDEDIAIIQRAVRALMDGGLEFHV